MAAEAVATRGRLALPKRARARALPTTDSVPFGFSADMPQHLTSALNPLASTAEVKAIAAAAYARGASSKEIKAEVDALLADRKRTAELQQVKERRELHPHRRELKAQRAELKQLITRVERWQWL